MRVRLPLDAERCLRANYTVAAGLLTAGMSTGFFAQNRQASSAYAFGFTSIQRYRYGPEERQARQEREVQGVRRR